MSQTVSSNASGDLLGKKYCLLTKKQKYLYRQQLSHLRYGQLSHLQNSHQKQNYVLPVYETKYDSKQLKELRSACEKELAKKKLVTKRIRTEQLSALQKQEKKYNEENKDRVKIYYDDNRLYDTSMNLNVDPKVYLKKSFYFLDIFVDKKDVKTTKNTSKDVKTAPTVVPVASKPVEKRPPSPDEIVMPGLFDDDDF